MTAAAHVGPPVGLRVGLGDSRGPRGGTRVGPSSSARPDLWVWREGGPLTGPPPSAGLLEQWMHRQLVVVTHTPSHDFLPAPVVYLSGFSCPPLPPCEPPL